VTEQHEDSLLGGYRVLDLADEKGLLCGKILGDLGADVIKIERPGGDPARSIGPFYKDIPDPEKSLYWMFCNTSKIGITLNIETADGREIFKKLVKGADIVVESFDPGYMAGLGLAYAELEKINPGIIMTSITPFGQTGPYRDFKTSDLVNWAMGGIMFQTGDTDRSPVWMSPHQSHFFGGSHGASGTMMALFHREMTGEGQHVDVSIQQGCMLALMITAEMWDLVGVITPRTGPYAIRSRGERPPLILPWVVPCKDGYAFVLGGGTSMAKMAGPLMLWALSEGASIDLEAIGQIQKKGYDVFTIPQEVLDSLFEPLLNFIQTKTKKELYEFSVQSGGGSIPSFSADEIMENSQLEVREFWEKVEHPELGDTITYPSAPVKVSEAPWKIRRRAPLIGEHNEEIYEKELGFSKEKLAILKQAKVV